MPLYSFFFFNDTATTEIYTLSLHDALPIFVSNRIADREIPAQLRELVKQSFLGLLSERTSLTDPTDTDLFRNICRSEEHTSELQSQSNLVCRLLLEKKKNTKFHYLSIYSSH